MLNALNRFISRLDSDPSGQNSKQGALGFQVLRNKNVDLNIEPWFDFIVGINGRMIEDSDPNLFAQEIRNCAGNAVTLAVWSAKVYHPLLWPFKEYELMKPEQGQRTRELHIPVSATAPTLGLSLQYSTLSTASNVWHILDVPANSPADAACLLPFSDYIIGTPEGILHGESGLGELVEDHMGCPLRLYVYNNEYDVTREVTINPRRDWGGEGALGCVLGFGALHRLPAPLSEPVAGPGETLFSTDTDAETARFSNEDPRSGQGADADNFFVPATTSHEPTEFLIPAQLISPPPPSGSPLHKKEKRQGHGHGKIPKDDKLMDDYFKEGEKKSREVDFAPTVKGTPLPPPPKSKGPRKDGETGAVPIKQDANEDKVD